MTDDDALFLIEWSPEGISDAALEQVSAALTQIGDSPFASWLSELINAEAERRHVSLAAPARYFQLPLTVDGQELADMLNWSLVLSRIECESPALQSFFKDILTKAVSMCCAALRIKG